MTEPRELTLEEVYGIEQRRVGFITDSDIVDLVSTIIALRQRLDLLQEDCTTLKNDRELFWSQLDEREKQLATAQDIIQGLTARVHELETRIRIANNSTTY